MLHQDRSATWQVTYTTWQEAGERASEAAVPVRDRRQSVANLWQIGFEWIRRRYRISQNTFTCNVFSWSRLGDLNPGPTHYEPFASPPRNTLLLVHTPA